jgi:predicted  nucleic acid-binding Zn-ribbon protein
MIEQCCHCGIKYEQKPDPESRAIINLCPDCMPRLKFSNSFDKENLDLHRSRKADLHNDNCE